MAAEQKRFSAEQKRFSAEQKRFSAEQKRFSAEQKSFSVLTGDSLGALAHVAAYDAVASRGSPRRPRAFTASSAADLTALLAPVLDPEQQRRCVELLCEQLAPQVWSLMQKAALELVQAAEAAHAAAGSDPHEVRQQVQSWLRAAH